MVRRYWGIALSVAAALVGSSTTQAQTTFTWNNAGGGSYHTAGNWNPAGGPPIFDDFAVFNTNATYGVTFANNGTQTIDFQVRHGNVTMSYINATANHFWGASGTNRVGPTAADAQSSATLNLINMASNPMLGGDLYVGYAAGKTGTLNVNTNGRWQSATGNLTVGSIGTGNVNIATSGTLQNSSISVNNAVIGSANGTGTLNISGLNASMTVNNVFTVGETGTSLGTVTVQNLGTLNVVDSLFLGAFSSQNNQLTVTGVGSTLNMGNDSMFVGDGGKGTLHVLNGGLVSSAANHLIGYGSGGNGTVNVSGVGSLFTATAGNTSAMTIGHDALGMVNVTAGGKLSMENYWIGATTNGNGTLTVNGAGSIVEATGANKIIEIGKNGTGQGTLNLQAGGVFTTTGANMDLQVASTASTTGAINITGAGSKLTVTGLLNLGFSGLGTLTMSSTGALDARSLFIANVGGSQATATLSNSSVINLTGSAGLGTGNLIVGGFGTGSLTLQSGSTATARGVVIGFGFPGTGTALVTGTNSKLKIDSSPGLVVGDDGHGALTAQFGGFIDAGGQAAWVGRNAGSTGSLTLNAATMLSSNLHVGDQGTGTATVRSGSTLSTTSSAILGVGSTGVGTMNLQNTGTLWTIGSTLTVGNNGQGMFNLQNGADAIANGITIGQNLGATGTVTLSGVNTDLTSTTFLALGGSNLNDGGIGTLTINSGSTTTVGTNLFLWPQGTINMNGGNLVMQSLIPNGGVVNWTSGSIKFSSNTVLSDTLLNTLLGTNHTLGNNQVLGSTPTGGLVIGNTYFTVDGGQIQANGLVNVGVTTINKGSVTVTNNLLNDMQGTYIVQNTGQTTFTGGVQNNGTFQLAGIAAKSSGGAFVNNGTLLGTGTLAHQLTNSTSGTIQIGGTDRLVVANNASMNVNNGIIQMLGGRIDVTGELTNAQDAMISGRGTIATATLTPGTQGLTNRGIIVISGGTGDVFGDVVNEGDGQFVTTGGAVTTFHDDVTHNGREIRTSAGSRTVFLGGWGGAGPFTGTGIAHFEGDLRPGNSPANVTFAGDIELSATAQMMVELGGIIPGSEYDRLTVTGAVSLNGLLDVPLLNGFLPKAGDSFTIIDNLGTDSVNGTFLGLPEGASFTSHGQLYTITYQGGTGNDVMLMAVPEPTTWALMGLTSAAAGYGVWRRRRAVREEAELIIE